MSTHTIKRILAVSLITLGTSTVSMASDFSLPFVNSSELGNAYAGWAASATDASTAYTNPAGLTRITNQQLVIAPITVQGTTTYSGLATTPVSATFGNATGTAGGFIPLLYFSTPVSNNRNVVLGLSANAPFGLGTNYTKTSLVRYAATRTQAVVMDLSPSIGVQLNEQVSLGLGFDAQRLTITLNHMFGPPIAIPDFEGQSHVAGWGYGYHAGILYQFQPCTRVGLSFNSQATFHTTGDSELFTPVSEIRTTNQKANVALPARTQLSIFHDINPCWDIMGSVLYTHWSTLSQVVLQNTVTPLGILPVVIPLEYHNTFDYAAGTNFKPNEQWILRFGVHYFNSPSKNSLRSVVDPASIMTLFGVGAHYQQNKQMGYDIAYAHNFFRQSAINFVTPLATLNGHSNSGADIFGAQITWNIC